MQTKKFSFLLQILVVLFAFLSTPKSAEAEEGKPGLAVLYFDYTGQDDQLKVLKKGLAQILISDLQSYTSDYEVVERERLQEILGELEHSTDARFDASSAAKVGQLLGAQYILLGSFFDLMGTLRIDARLIEVETGRILGSAGKSGPMTDFFAIEAPLAVELGKILTNASSGTRTPSPTPQIKVPSRANPKPRKRVNTSTIRNAAVAMDAKDKGDTTTANRIAREVGSANPELMAMLDLSSMYQ
jgi:TolB-like protein